MREVLIVLDRRTEIGVVVAEHRAVDRRGRLSCGWDLETREDVVEGVAVAVATWVATIQSPSEESFDT